MGFLFLWLLVGYTCFLRFRYLDERQLTISDLFVGLPASALGFIIPLIMFFVCYGDKVIFKKRY